MFAIDIRQNQTRSLLATREPSIDVKGRVRDSVASAHLFRPRPGFLLAQDRDDLLLAEPASLHGPSPLQATDSISFRRSFRGAGQRESPCTGFELSSSIFGRLDGDVLKLAKWRGLGTHLLIVIIEPGSAESAALRYSAGTSSSSLGGPV